MQNKNYAGLKVITSNLIQTNFATDFKLDMIGQGII